MSAVDDGGSGALTVRATASRAWAGSRRRSSSDRATPTTGTASRPAATSRYSAGNSFLRARSPVAPKRTRASALTSG